MANQLINEQSLYLQQHAHNPVNWYPWGDEAFTLAREANKPVIVSIGYAACHWCHVMERESFEDEATAAYMNDHFICIKVDREEHPDVDHLYMDAVQAISGSGGWPLNVFVTPDRVPFYGGTYYPPRPAYSRPSWKQLLERMSEVWNHQQEEVMGQAGQMLDYLKQASAVANAPHEDWNETACREAVAHLLEGADKEWGGFGNAPKFPGTMALSFLLEHAHFYQDEAAKAHALHSLDAMIAGGIYDQLGGGFARYSTDRQWLAPHFEKMLYDNALLVLTLCDAWQLTAKPRYREVIEETIAFVNRELRDAESGLFYSALDADSEGEEGKYYTWGPEELNAVLEDDAALAAAYFGVQASGNWEGTNILHVPGKLSKMATRFGLSEAEAKERIEQVKRRLFTTRGQRTRPATDDKSLLSWNALMNLALSRAGVALGSPDYLAQAKDHLAQLERAFGAGGNGLLHTWKKGQARIPAKLDDYAYLIQAMLQLASAAGENQWIVQAAEWARYVVAHFSDEQQRYFYFTSDAQADIPVRKTDVYDGATPSANAVMAANLMLLGMLMEESEWVERAENMLHTISGTAVRYTYSFGYWSILLQRLLKGNKTAVITGTEGRKALSRFQSHYTPGVFPVLADEQESGTNLPLLKDKKPTGTTSIFVCTTHECLAPQPGVEAALRLLKSA